MKNFFSWLKSPKSDFLFFVILLILLNLVLSRVNFHSDITKNRSYSLSPASREVVNTLTEPLSVKVFFSKDLPTTYRSVYQYVRDLLVEYKKVGNKNFDYTLFNMKGAEDESVATSYGLRKVQVQEVKNNEVQLKQIWMGLAIVYGDAIEVIDAITDESGFEYKLTTKISKMISTTNALSVLGANERINLSLYASDELGQFGINGFSQVDEIVKTAFEAANKKATGKLFYQKKTVSSADASGLADKYALQLFNWQNKDGSPGQGVFGLVLEYKKNWKSLPLSIERSLFGYVIAGTDDLEKQITDSVSALLSNTLEVGYLTGHGEVDLMDEKGNNLKFVNLLSDMYSLKKLNLGDENIPQNLSSIIINGAKDAFGDAELYKIDQFLMHGGNLILFNDPFDMKTGDYYTPSTFTPIHNSLDKILSKYGVELPITYVFDENCYKARQQTMAGVQSYNLYWAPQLSMRELNQTHVITKNLGYVIFLQPGQIKFDVAKGNKDLRLTVLASTSDAAWTQSQNVQLSPTMQVPYDKSTEKKEPLAILLEGKFPSAFDKNILETAAKEKSETSQFETTTHLSRGAKNAKVFIASTSYITSNQLIDDSGSEPIALFVRNVIDYLNGNEDLCVMRTKGASFETLKTSVGLLPESIEYFSIFGIPIIIVIIALSVWFKREKRRKRIHDEYNPSDKRQLA